MAGEKDLTTLLATMEPILQEGDFVFCSVPGLGGIDLQEVVMFFREQEGVTLILRKEVADRLDFAYGFVAAWITLSVHSSLEAVGFTAAFSKALAEPGISCNVVAGYYHDHIFVGRGEVGRAMEVLRGMRRR